MAGEELYSHFQGRLYGSAITTYVLACLIVPIRLWCRISRSSVRDNSSLGLDDAFSVLALLIATAFFFVCILGMGESLGKHAFTEVSIAHVIVYLEWFFVAQLLYILGLGIVKFSLLVFYWRLFSFSALRIPIIFTFAAVMSWVIALTLMAILTCDPIRAQWDITTPTTRQCISFQTICYVGSPPNILTDIVILILPIPHVLKLRAPLAQRLLLAGIFMLGCFVSVVSIVRFVIITDLPLTSRDTTYNTKEVAVWSIVELNVGLICSCLPSTKPALELLHIPDVFSNISTLWQSRGWGVKPGTIKGDSEGSSREGGQPPNCGRHSPHIRDHRNRLASLAGLFSVLTNLTSLTTVNDEDDSHLMIDGPVRVYGKHQTQVNSSGCPAGDTEEDGSLRESGMQNLTML